TSRSWRWRCAFTARSRNCCYFYPCRLLCLFFFFQAEDGIRDATVTGVQTCALPILARSGHVLSRAHCEPAREADESGTEIVLDRPLKADTTTARSGQFTTGVTYRVMASRPH